MSRFVPEPNPAVTAAAAADPSSATRSPTPSGAAASAGGQREDGGGSGSGAGAGAGPATASHGRANDNGNDGNDDNDGGIGVGGDRNSSREESDQQLRPRSASGFEIYSGGGSRGGTAATAANLDDAAATSGSGGGGSCSGGGGGGGGLVGDAIRGVVRWGRGARTTTTTTADVVGADDVVELRGGGGGGRGEERRLTTNLGTVAWAAPEMLFGGQDGRGEYTAKVSEQAKVSGRRPPPSGLFAFLAHHARFSSFVSVDIRQTPIRDVLLLFFVSVWGVGGLIHAFEVFRFRRSVVGDHSPISVCRLTCLVASNRCCLSHRCIHPFFFLLQYRCSLPFVPVRVYTAYWGRGRGLPCLSRLEA